MALEIVRLSKAVHLNLRTTLIALVFVTLGSAAYATEFEMSRIAREINFASSYLAKEVKYSRGFGSVGQRADRLARESADLVDAIRRNRSPSVVRSRFADVGRRYADLENVYLRAYRNYSDDFVFQQVGLISDLYSELVNVYYFTHYYENQPRVFTFVQPRSGFSARQPQRDVYQVQPSREARRLPNQRMKIPAVRNREHRNAIRERLDKRDSRFDSGQRFIREPDTSVIETRRRGQRQQN